MMHPALFLHLVLVVAASGPGFVPVLENGCFSPEDVARGLPRRCCDATIETDMCWDETFTFERCCQEVVSFDLTHCCGSSSKCLDFSFRCAGGLLHPAETCWIRPKITHTMRRFVRRFGRNATTCDDGSALFPPRYIKVRWMTGDVKTGHHLSVKGNIFWNEVRQRKPESGLDSIDCLGRFLQREDKFGSCTLRLWWSPSHELWRFPLRVFERPLKDLSCSDCQEDCKIYALSFKQDGWPAENQLILAVPGACTNGDVAFRILPHVMHQRSGQAQENYGINKVRLHHFVPGESCEHDGRPDVFPILAICMFLCTLPRLLLRGLGAKNLGTNQREKMPLSVDLPVDVDLVNLLRVLALWNTLCFHLGSSFPFSSFAEFLRCSLLPKDNTLKDVFLWRMQTLLQGLFVINTIFLVLQCQGWTMFCKRLLRKVGRQLVVLYSIGVFAPMILYTSSPINCINVPAARRFSTWVALHFFFGNRDIITYNWSFEMDLRIFLLIGASGILRKSLPFALPAACVVYWAYIVGIAAREGPCPFENTEELEVHVIMVTYGSFWVHWFPTSLLLLNLDTCLRSPRAIYLMGRLKQKFGRSLILFMATMLVISLCIGTGTGPILRQDWQRLGFSHCPMVAGWVREGNSPSVPYVLAGLPFFITVFTSLHLASAPALEGQKEDRDHLLPLQVPLAFLCEAFRHTGFAFNIWHFLVLFDLLPARFPAWMELLKVAQKEQLTMEVQLLFVMPIAVSSFALAWATYHLLEKPWARVLHTLSEHCPVFLLYSVSAGYFAMNIGLGYSTGFWWSQRGFGPDLYQM